MTPRRPTVLGASLAIAVTAVTATLSRVPYAAEPSDRAVLRLSWRYQPTSDEGCRRPTREELQALPAHMRNPDACLREPRSYRLTLAVDGRVVLEKTLHPAGARQDRPVFVYEEASLTAGTHRIDVRFVEGLEGGRAGARTLSWSRPVTVQPHEIIVITYDRLRDALDRKEPPEDST